MAKVVKSLNTPSQIVCQIIKAGMGAKDISTHELAKRMQIHVNTVYSDLRDPDRIPQNRLWLYFTVLGIPVYDALSRFAQEFAMSLVRR